MAVKKMGKNKYLVDYRDITGKRVRKTFYTKYEADCFYNEVQLNKNKGLSCTVDKNLTVVQACEYYLEKHIKLHCKEKTIGENTRIINKDIVPYFRNTKLHTLTKVQIEDFIYNLRIERELCNGTLNKYLTILGAIIEKQIENGTIFQNVAKKIKKFKHNPEEGRAFTLDELEHILSICKEQIPKFYPMLYTAINTGMRRGELCALKWENINFKDNTIHVVKTENKTKLGTTKTKTSKRHIDMTPSLKKFLLELKLKSGHSSDFVFSNSKGGFMNGNNVANRYVKPLVKNSNIGHFSMHDFRHTYATHLTKICGDIHYVQHQLGHARPSITLDVYGHYLPSKQNTPSEIMEARYVLAY